jgi:hypothetical protein
MLKGHDVNKFQESYFLFFEIRGFILLFYLTVNSSISANWFILSLLNDADLTAEVISL